MSIFWDATISGISRRALALSSDLIVDAYRVEYTGWSSRYTEWVEPGRVVEPNENNKLLQVSAHAFSASSIKQCHPHVFVVFSGRDSRGTGNVSLWPPVCIEFTCCEGIR